MKKLLPATLAALLTILSCSKADNTPRLVIITLDGLRWQELYSGADESLMGSNKYWRETPAERREALMPFIWQYVPEHGYMIGNRSKESYMQVSNTMNFSYPGYSEMFCGWADDERITSNNPVPNPNVSVLEVAWKDPRYNGSLSMYSSWESVRYAVNSERAGFPASSAHEPSFTNTYVTRMLEDMDAATPGEGFGYSERLDLITYGMAMETLRESHPKVFYVAFGDTDEFAHEGQYDNYLEAAHWTDRFIGRIVEYCESDPFYKGNTTYLITCDHGRGVGPEYTDHGENTARSGETWFMAFGKDVPVLGETSGNGPFYTRQFAATIADILDVDFTPGNGVKSAPIDPEYSEND